MNDSAILRKLSHFLALTASTFPTAKDQDLTLSRADHSLIPARGAHPVRGKGSAHPSSTHEGTNLLSA